MPVRFQHEQKSNSVYLAKMAISKWLYWLLIFKCFLLWERN